MCEGGGGDKKKGGWENVMRSVCFIMSDYRLVIAGRVRGLTWRIYVSCVFASACMHMPIQCG